MRLQNFSPQIPEGLVTALASISIRTDTDLLLSEDPTKIFMRLPQELGLNLLEFQMAIEKVAELASASFTGGDILLEHENKRQEDIFADDMLLGVPEVDALLNGFCPPRVVEVSGDRASGKTALALQLVLRHLTQVRDSSALWIDSGGDFSPERVNLMLEEMITPDAHTVLERLQVSLAFDIEAVHDVLESLRQSLSSRNSDTEVPITRCVVIDSITPLLGPLLSATSSQGHAIITTFMRQLRAYAESFSLTIIVSDIAGSRMADLNSAITQVINSSTKVLPRNTEAVFNTMRKPALGPSFTFTADATLWLSQRPAEDSGDEAATTHVVEVLRSRISRSKTWARFKIRQGLLVSA